MKYVAWFVGIVFTLLLAVYTLAFTSFGNNLLKPFLQEQIQAQAGLELELEHFHLRIDELRVLLALDPKNKITLEGTYSLFSLSFDLAYKVEASDLSALAKLAEMPLAGRFFTHGTITGDLDTIKVKGQSDLASSETHYEVDILSFKPQALLATVKGLEISELLSMLGQGAYASSRLDGDLTLTSLDPKNLQGDAKITLKEGKIDTAVMQKVYDVTLPATEFHSTSQVKLQAQDLIYTTEFVSNLATIRSKGSIRPQTLALDLDYHIEIKELALLKPLTKTDLRGAFHLRGDIKGDKKSLLLNGISDIAGSDTVFQATLKEFAPHKIHARIKDLKVDKALYMIHQPHYLDALFSAEIKIDNAAIGDLAGSVDADLKNGVIDRSTMKRLHNVTLGDTTLSSNAKIKLQGDTIQYSTTLDSNLASLSSKGKFLPETLFMDLIYDLGIKELALLKPITQTDLRGALKLKGDIKGDKEKLTINGISDLAGSDTVFQATLKEFAPTQISAHIKDLKLEKALYMLHQPHYTDGLLSLNMKIEDARIQHLKGEIDTKITRGILDTKLLSKEMAFESPMPPTTYTMQSFSTLRGNEVDSKITLDSTLAKIDIKSALLKIKEGSLRSDYTANIKSLEQLYFVTQQHLRGGLLAKGELKKDKDLDFTLRSDIAGGTIDARLHNDYLVADISSMQTLKILHILLYPEIFESSLDAKLKYNLAQSKGDINGKLSQGRFTQNELLTLLKQYKVIDLYKENFVGDLSAHINKEKILSSLDLRSNKSAITTKDAKLDSKTQKIDATLNIVANKQPLTATLKGDIASPKVRIDLNKLMESKAGEKIDKEIQRGAEKLLKKLF